MDDSHAMSLEQIRALVAANSVMRFAGQRRQEVYEWVERTLVRHQYAGLRKPDKGVLRLYLAQMTGLKRAQVTRLITGYQQTGRVIAAPYLRARFPSIYTAADVELLSYVDRAHGNLSGPATRRILEREYSEYGQAAYQRLAGISVAHLYRLRATQAYRKRNTTYQPTRPTPIPIGERRKPQPQGKPGYLRVDTVHRGRRAQAHRLRLHRCTARRDYESVPPGTPQPVRQLPPTVCRTHGCHPSQRQTPQNLPALGHAVGVVWGAAGLRELLASRRYPGRTGAFRPRADRYRSRAGHAARQAQALRQLQTGADSMKFGHAAPPVGRRSTIGPDQAKNQDQSQNQNQNRSKKGKPTEV